MRIGEVFKEMIYGGGGAILTRAISSVAEGLVPASFAGSPMMRPIVQAAVAVVPVRWLGKKFLGGQKQADLMMLGGLISAGLAMADVYLPNLQGQLTGIFRAPLTLTTAPQAQTTVAGFSDVYDVPTLPGSMGFQGLQGGFAGFGDVEDVPAGIWG